MSSPSLRQLAYAQIHEWIVNGDFPKGTATSEVELSRRLEMSRTPIRAALQQLELEGYVRIASKHGIIILDSSSQRVGDLLEIVISMTLFSVCASRYSRLEELRSFASAKNEVFRSLTTSAHDDLQPLIDFEFELLRDMISLCHNDEMARTFHSASSRLFWSRNRRRWQAPFTSETIKNIGGIIDTLADDTADAFREAIFAYLHTLKRTWL
ncbi:GntR family transcriptional regulator [Cohnella soli]|uniref:GntR family transcriptional regulator n=1 Tax=Cohnella soli TaxID=425005 RepID=A0ABW0HMW2_9BACL